MLTKALRHVKRNELLVRTVHAAVLPRVDYGLIPLGETLGAAFHRV